MDPGGRDGACSRRDYGLYPAGRLPPYPVPYQDFDKFQARSHRWILVGLPLLASGLYLSLCLAIWSLFDGAAIVIAALPFAAAGVIFVLRKGQL
jgi:hypothetical protein